MSPLDWILAAVGTLLLLGLIELGFARARHASALLFVFEFRQRLSELMQTLSQDSYEWLTLNANRMQRQLGSEGFMTFRPPFANYVVHNYAVVPNTLTELRKCFTDDTLSGGDLPSQYHALLDDTLLRHEGTVRERVRLNTRSILNPLKWLTRGVRALLGLPVWTLQSVGLISEASGDRFKSSRLFRLISGMTALLGFFSAIVGLVTGWAPFLVLARKVVLYVF